MKTERPDLSIVIPAYREAKRIGKTLDTLSKFLKQDQTLKHLKVEVVVASPDCPDNTHQVAKSKAGRFANFRFVETGPHVGKGHDVRAGMMSATGQAIIFMDADLATPLKHLPKFYKLHNRGVDVVVGTRNLKKHHPNLIRRSISITGNILFRILGGVWVEDSQCGFKLFSAEAAQTCFGQLSIMGWGFDMEVLAIARSNKMAIRTVRINDWHQVSGGTFEIGMVANTAITLVDLVKIAIRRLRRTYLV